MFHLMIKKYLSLYIQTEIPNNLENVKYKKKKETRMNLMKEMESIQEMYSLVKEPETKTKFISEHRNNNPRDTYEQCVKQYNLQKDSAVNKLKYLKNKHLQSYLL